MIVERIYEYARIQPQKPAVVIDGQTVSYFQFANCIESLRKVWARHNLPPASVAVVVTKNRMLGWNAILALQSLGLVTVAADTISTLKKLDLRKVSCTLVVKTPKDGLDEDVSFWADALSLELPPVLFNNSLPEPFISTPGAGHILFTSGTTGTYKKVFHDAALDHSRFAAHQAVSGSPRLGVTNLTSYGPWTAVGYRWPLLAWACGATVVIDRRKDWPNHLGDHGVNRAFLTPAALNNSINALLNQGKSKSGPRWTFELFAGGGVTSASLIRSIRDHITPNLNLTFGCTEMFLPVMRTRAQEQEDDFWLKPMGSREIDIVDEMDCSCPDLVEGLLRIRRQPTDYNGYMDDPDTTSKVFRDGWFYPGDMAMRRSDGSIRVLGRAADVINVNGNKLASAALEEAVRGVLNASDVCAFSGLMADNESRLIIVVETSQPISQKRFEHLAIQHLSGMGTIQFFQLKSFPRTSTGTQKVDRVALRKQILKRQLKQT